MTFRTVSVLLAAACFLVTTPPRADAQERAPDVHVTIIVEAPSAPQAAPQAAPEIAPPWASEASTAEIAAAAPEPGRLRLIEPGFQPHPRNIPNTYGSPSRREDGVGLLLASSLMVGLGVVGIAAAASEVPHYAGEGWPEWAAVTFALGAELTSLGLLAIGGAAALMLGDDDGAAGMVAVAAAEIVFSVLLGSIAIAITPGVGPSWDDPRAQQRVSEMLGAESFALGITGALGVIASVLAAEERAAIDPSRNIAVAPMLSPTTAGVSVGGRF